MIIEELRMKNFRSHRDTKVRFSREKTRPGITVIVGDNGAGKTSILDAISFALFKLKPEGVSVDELITLGATESEVSLSFRSDGRRYLVRRVRNLKRGAESYFYRLDSELGTLIAKTEREVTAEVENTLGMNGELFASAVHIKQGEIDRLLSSDPATRKRHIGKLIGTEDLENAHKNFLEVIRAFEARAQALSMVPGELEEKREAVENQKKEISALHHELREIEKKISNLKEGMEEVEKRGTMLEGIREREKEVERQTVELSYLEKESSRITDYEIQLKETEGKSQRAAELEREIESLKREIHSFDVAMDRESRARAELEREMIKLASLEKGVEETLGKASSLIGSPLDSVAELEKGHKRALTSLKNKRDEFLKRRDLATRILGEKNAALDAVRKSTSELSEAFGTCPVCGRELTQSHKRKLMARYSKESEALSLKIESLAADIKLIKRDAADTEQKIDRLSKISVGAAKEKEQRIEESEAKTLALERGLKEDKAALGKLPPLLEKKTGLESEFEGLKPFKERHIEARGFLRKNLPQKESLKTRAAQLRDWISGNKKELETAVKGIGLDFTTLPGAIEDNARKTRELQETLRNLEKDEASHKSTLKWKEKRYFELSEEIKKREELEKELKKLLRFKGLLEKLRAIFHKDALQRQLRLKAKPLIEDYTRDIFLSFNLPYTDVTLTDDFSLKVHGEGGEVSIDMLSGGERIAAALALRIGLSRALSGPVMELVILDEPTIHLDAQRRRELVEVIRRLATIPQTIVVTHDKEFEESADMIIEVEKIDGVSVVKS